MNTETKLRDDNGGELPVRITYTRSFTYDVAEVINGYKETHGQDSHLTEDDIYQIVLDFALEDFGGCRPKELTETYIYSDQENK